MFFHHNEKKYLSCDREKHYIFVLLVVEFVCNACIKLAEERGMDKEGEILWIEIYIKFRFYCWVSWLKLICKKMIYSEPMFIYFIFLFMSEA